MKAEVSPLQILLPRPSIRPATCFQVSRTTLADPPLKLPRPRRRAASVVDWPHCPLMRVRIGDTWLCAYYW
jgi:hypothetical protein